MLKLPLIGVILYCGMFSLKGIGGENQVDPALKAQIGEEAPNFLLKDVHVGKERKSFYLEDLKGKVVILEYWGPFCGPCIKAFPHINRLIETFKDQPVCFISIADRGYEGCKSVLKRNRLNSWQVFDVTLFDPFGVNAVPRTIIIDKNGKVAAYTNPKKLDEKMIRRVLAGKLIGSHYKASEFPKE